MNNINNKKVVWEKIDNTNEIVINKDTLLPAMQQILKEYKTKTHTAWVADCTLCQLFKRVIDMNIECTKCPMTVFKGVEPNHLCLNRRCAPVSCPVNTEEELIKLKAVKEFYSLAIAKVKEMSNKELNADNAFNFLIDIDNELGDKYKLVKEEPKNNSQN
jgi:hypothetical protein